MNRNFTKMLKGYSRTKAVHNIVALVGYITTIIFRYWGFTSFVCALFLLVTGARIRQYVGLIVANIAYASLMYGTFGAISSQEFILYSSIYFLCCLLYWVLTLE